MSGLIQVSGTVTTVPIGCDKLDLATELPVSMVVADDEPQTQNYDDNKHQTTEQSLEQRQLLTALIDEACAIAMHDATTHRQFYYR